MTTQKTNAVSEEVKSANVTPDYLITSQPMIDTLEIMRADARICNDTYSPVLSALIESGKDIAEALLLLAGNDTSKIETARKKNISSVAVHIPVNNIVPEAMTTLEAGSYSFSDLAQYFKYYHIFKASYTGLEAKTVLNKSDVSYLSIAKNITKYLAVINKAELSENNLTIF